MLSLICEISEGPLYGKCFSTCRVFLCICLELGKNDWTRNTLISFEHPGIILKFSIADLMLLILIFSIREPFVFNYCPNSQHWVQFSVSFPFLWDFSRFLQNLVTKNCICWSLSRIELYFRVRDLLKIHHHISEVDNWKLFIYLSCIAVYNEFSYMRSIWSSQLLK